MLPNSCNDLYPANMFVNFFVSQLHVLLFSVLFILFSFMLCIKLDVCVIFEVHVDSTFSSGGTVGRAMDLQYAGREFESWLGTIA